MLELRTWDSVISILFLAETIIRRTGISLPSQMTRKSANLSDNRRSVALSIGVSVMIGCLTIVLLMEA
jgi:hypothetical protein